MTETATTTTKRAKRPSAPIDIVKHTVTIGDATFALMDLPGDVQKMLALKHLRVELTNTDTPASHFESLKSGERSLAPRVKKAKELTPIQINIATLLRDERCRADGVKGIDRARREQELDRAKAEVAGLGKADMAAARAAVLSGGSLLLLVPAFTAGHEQAAA